ncbi:MAG: AbrB/MazE/SpoVT family DNA-binding domain-containing protein [Defluviitaleaceae bacterium]|nr:AbrB/MazE/SpoVT family DNA-binding domain-containing protein [Defluviitaleaceae bacterium]
MVVRKLDPLGRIVIPKEMRKTLAIDEGDDIAITLEGGGVVLTRHSSACFICDSYEEVQRENKALLCKICRRKINTLILD